METGRYFRIAFSWFLLLQMINLSVNPPRHITVVKGMLTMAEDLSINKLESIYELISEIVFKIDVPETQDADDDQLQKTLFVFHLPEIASAALKPAELAIEHHFSYCPIIPDHIPARKSPPPRLLQSQPAI